LESKFKIRFVTVRLIPVKENTGDFEAGKVGYSGDIEHEVQNVKSFIEGRLIYG
jgi:hypothetical protein